MRCNRPAACVADEPYALGRVKPGLLWSSLLSKGLSNCWGFGGTVQKMRRNRMLNKMNSSCGKISTLLFSLKKEEKKYCAIWTVHNCCTAGTRQVVCRKEKCFLNISRKLKAQKGLSTHSSYQPRLAHNTILTVTSISNPSPLLQKPLPKWITAHSARSDPSFSQRSKEMSASSKASPQRRAGVR